MESVQRKKVRRFAGYGVQVHSLGVGNAVGA